MTVQGLTPERIIGPVFKQEAPGGDASASCGILGVYVLSQACCRHCAAVALRSGCSSSMVSRKSLNSAAWSRGHSYFSSRTSNRPQGFRLEMWRSSPETGTGGVSLAGLQGNGVGVTGRAHLSC